VGTSAAEEQYHLLSDGTQRGQNDEWALVLLRNNTTYFLMAHKEAEMMRGH
jgi:hypothetical protein